jgi:hypothetical protein
MEGGKGNKKNGRRVFLFFNSFIWGQGTHSLGSPKGLLFIGFWRIIICRRIK